MALAAHHHAPHVVTGELLARAPNFLHSWTTASLLAQAFDVQLRPVQLPPFDEGADGLGSLTVLRFEVLCLPNFFGSFFRSRGPRL